LPLGESFAELFDLAGFCPFMEFVQHLCNRAIDKTNMSLTKNLKPFPKLFWYVVSACAASVLA
jgi:hypothetical protein